MLRFTRFFLKYLTFLSYDFSSWHTGLHTSLKKGVVHLDVAYQICKKGDKLTPEQARLLKLFEHMQAEFKIKVKMMFNKSEESVEIIDASVEDHEEMEESESDEAEAEEEQMEQPKKKKKTKTDHNNNV